MISIEEKLYIGGEWSAPVSQKKIDIFSASTGEKIGIVPEASQADVDVAVAAARKALHSKEWGGLNGAERGLILNRFPDAVEKRGNQLAKSVSMQNGMPLIMSEQLESGFVVGMLRYYAALATSLVDEERRQSPLGFSTLVRRERIGVVGAIVPWNFPVALSIMKIGPALAAGCAVVIKPSPETVLDCYILAEAAEEAGVPPGALNWVPGGARYWCVSCHSPWRGQDCIHRFYGCGKGDCAGVRQDSSSCESRARWEICCNHSGRCRSRKLPSGHSVCVDVE